VRSAWKAYHDHLATTYPQDKPEEPVYLNQRAELFTDLVYEMSIAVGYSELDKGEIRKISYVPIMHENIETEQTVIRKGFSDILSGKSALSMRVVEFPFAVTPPEPPPSSAPPDSGPAQTPKP
jgi:hypothetical protein